MFYLVFWAANTVMPYSYRLMRPMPRSGSALGEEALLIQLLGCRDFGGRSSGRAARRWREAGKKRARCVCVCVCVWVLILFYLYLYIYIHIYGHPTMTPYVCLSTHLSLYVYTYIYILWGPMYIYICMWNLVLLEHPLRPISREIDRSQIPDIPIGAPFKRALKWSVYSVSKSLNKNNPVLHGAVVEFRDPE